MRRYIPYILIIASVALLLIDFISEGFRFDKGRWLRNTSSVLIIFSGCWLLYQNHKKAKADFHKS